MVRLMYNKNNCYMYMHCPTVLNKPKLKLKSGQTIIEIVLSIGLAAMVLSALLVLGAASSKTVASSLRRSQATKLAVQGIEAMRYYRDENGYFKLKSGECYTIDTTGKVVDIPSCVYQEVVAPSGDSGANNTFQRMIEVIDDLNNTKRVTVTVQWADSTNKAEDVSNVKIVSLLSNW